MLTKQNIVHRILMLMGSCTSMGISLNSLLAELGHTEVETSTLAKFIGVLRNIKMSMDAVSSGIESLILDMEQHRGELAALVFQQQHKGDPDAN